MEKEKGIRRKEQMSQEELDEFFRETPPDVEDHEPDTLDDKLKHIEDELPDRYKKLL